MFFFKPGKSYFILAEPNGIDSVNYRSEMLQGSLVMIYNNGYNKIMFHRILISQTPFNATRFNFTMPKISKLLVF